MADFRWSNFHGRLPQAILPKSLQTQTTSRQRNRLLQIRRSNPHSLHFLSLLRRSPLNILRFSRHQKERPPSQHPRRIRLLLPRRPHKRMCNQHRNAHNRPNPPRNRHRIRQSGSSVIPFRNRSGENPRPSEPTVPVDDLPRDSDRELHQLRNRADSSLGMAIVARISDVSGGDNVHRRFVSS